MYNLNKMTYFLLESTFCLYLNSKCLTGILLTILRIILKYFFVAMSPKGKIILYYKKKDTTEPLNSQYQMRNFLKGTKLKQEKKKHSASLFTRRLFHRNRSKGKTY